MPETPIPESATISAAEKVLLVDDNPTNLQVLVQTLAGKGCKLLVARNGEDALAIAKKTRPALILLDIMMPGIDGYEVCRRLKAEPETRDIAVIFLSALGETRDKVRGLELGAVDYVGKPFQAEEVVARVNTHLTIHRLQQDLQAANQRMKRDLDTAARVQQALLPERAPVTDRADFAWAYRPCDELAGDSLNLFQLDDRHVGLYVVDVSGHGVPSALLSVSVTRSLLPGVGPTSLVTVPSPDPSGSTIVSPAEVATRLNGLYQMDARNTQYFTLLYGVLDTHERRLRCVIAGHPGPVLIRAGQPPRAFDVPAFPIGMMDGTTYTDTVIELRSGDRLYLYSDGVTEETNPEDVPFGNERLFETLDGAR
ncbi:MAG: SpoIIE family protein phosphatase, partial [Vicinamibacterales bacterium]